MEAWHEHFGEDHRAFGRRTDDQRSVNVVYLICLVHRVGLDQPNKQDKPNKRVRPNRPDQPARSRAGTLDGGSVETRRDPSKMGRQSGRADRRAS